MEVQPADKDATSSNAPKKTAPGAGDLNYFFPTDAEADMDILEAYISQPRMALSDLNRFPIIHKLFRKFNTLMCSSASVEVGKMFLD